MPSPSIYPGVYRSVSISRYESNKVLILNIKFLILDRLIATRILSKELASRTKLELISSSSLSKPSSLTTSLSFIINHNKLVSD